MTITTFRVLNIHVWRWLLVYSCMQLATTTVNNYYNIHDDNYYNMSCGVDFLFLLYYTLTDRHATDINFFVAMHYTLTTKL